MQKTAEKDLGILQKPIAEFSPILQRRGGGGQKMSFYFRQKS